MNLYNQYRPDDFDQVYGNENTVDSLEAMFNANTVPHVFLFTGPSGCGKTTLARIIKNRLGCSDADYTEVDSADFRGIESIRNIRSKLNYKAQQGDCRVILMDECHQLTKDAQTALLKALEDTPEHVYFIMATTNPEKLIPTIKTRCTVYELEPLAMDDMMELLDGIREAEEVKVDKKVLTAICRHAKGSPRKAINALESILYLAPEKQEAYVHTSDDAETRAIDLAKALMTKASWKKVGSILKTMDDEPETVRRAVIGYHSKVLMSKDSAVSYLVLEAFCDNFYDSGKAGLVRACYEVING